MSNLRAAYVDAADSIVQLLGRAEVRDSWDEPSALPEWKVSGLAGHLAGQLYAIANALEAPPTALEPIALLEHYRRASWIQSGVDDDVNVEIRESGDERAAEGHAALVVEVQNARGLVARRLPDEPADRAVLIPWQGWALTLDDFLVTRMMEIAVHSDDLAVSVDVETPSLGSDVLDPVLALLTRLAVHRHGQSAVLRALTRRERAPEFITAF